MAALGIVTGNGHIPGIPSGMSGGEILFHSYRAVHNIVPGDVGNSEAALRQYTADGILVGKNSSQRKLVGAVFFCFVKAAIFADRLI